MLVRSSSTLASISMAIQAMASLFVSLLFLSTVDRLTAQTTPPVSLPSSPTITCSFPNTSMVSSTACTYYDQQNMASLTGGCQAFLTNVDPSPSLDCCNGMNSVAYGRTACICLATFYPPPNFNATLQLQLPSLCKVTTDLCNRCPAYLVGRVNSSPVGECSLAPNRRF